MCAEDELSREWWVRALSGAAAALGGRPMALSNSYSVNYQALLGVGVFAVVVRASELHGRGGGVALKVCGLRRQIHRCTIKDKLFGVTFSP